MPGTSWIMEGYRQFELAVLWECGANLLQAQADGAPFASDLALKLQNEVLYPLVEHSWLPGVDFRGSILPGLRQRWSDPETSCLDDTTALPAEVFRTWFCEDWHETDIAKAFHRSLKATLNKFRNTPWPSGSSPKVPNDAGERSCTSEDEMVELWIREGISLLRWGEIAGGVHDLVKVDDVPQACNNLRGQCGQLASEVLHRTRGARRTRWLRDPWEVHLLEQLHDAMVSCQELFGRLLEQCCQLDRNYATLMGPFGRLLRWRGKVDAWLQQPELGSWPPIWIASVADLLPIGRDSFRRNLEIKASLSGRGTEPSNIPARVGVVMHVIDALDQHPANDRIDWGRVQEHARLLVPEVELLRSITGNGHGSSRSPNDFAIDEAPTVSTERVKSTGVLVNNKVLRKVVILRPSSSRRIGQALEELSERLPANADSLRMLCRSLSAKVSSVADLKIWWTNASEEDRSELWFFVQRACAVQKLVPEMHGQIDLVFQELRRVGFRFHQPPPQAGTVEVVWLVWSEATEPVQSERLVVGGTVVGPDGTAIAPSVWIVPASSAHGTQRLAALAEVARIVSWQDPEATVWKPAMDAFLLAVQPPKPVVEGGVDLLHQLHTRLNELRQLALATPAVSLYERIVRTLWDYLTIDCGLKLWPSLDQNLDFPIVNEVPNWVEPFLQASNLKAGRILRVDRFSSGSQPVQCWISYGATIPKELQHWWTLPSPADFRLGQIMPAPLRDWHGRLGRLALNPQSISHELNKAKQRFQAALESAEGQRWFDLLAREAYRVTEPGAAARLWFDALLNSQWCRCYPQPSGYGAWIWPHAAPIVMGGIEWEESADVPPREVIGSVVRFGVTPELAQCKLSLGVLPADSSLRWALKLKATIADAKGWSPLTSKLVSVSLEERFTGTRPDVWSCVQPLLNALLKVARKNAGLGDDDLVPSTPNKAVVFDEWMQLLAKWCAAYDAAIVPDGWRFGGMGEAQLSSDEAVETSFAFTSYPHGTVLLRRFGLRHKGHIAATASVTLSAGPSPHSYTELMRLVERPKGDAERQLLHTLQDWPRLTVVEGKEICLMARDLFREYWSVQEQWEKQDHHRSAEFNAHLVALLDSMGYMVRYPEMDDVDDRKWVRTQNAHPGARRIASTRRPGLFNRSDNAILENAEVEVE